MPVPIAVSTVTVVLLVIGGLVFSWVLLLFVTSLVERQHLMPFSPEPLTVYPGDTPAYLLAMNASLLQRGFEYGGMYADTRGGMYHLYATFWFSPDRTTVVHVVGGTIAGMQYKATALTSVTGDGRHLVTRDEFDAGEYSGITERVRVLYGDFAELWNAHQRRLLQRAEGIWRFPPAYAPYNAEVTLRYVRVQHTAARGYMKWIDPTRGTFRYTVKAAFHISVVNFFGDLLKSTREVSRVSKARPGDSMPAFPVMLARTGAEANPGETNPVQTPGKLP
jgi:hypothetical protein